MIDVMIDISSIYGLSPNAIEQEPELNLVPLTIQSTIQSQTSASSTLNMTSAASPSPIQLPFDEESMSVIRLNNGMVLVLRQVTDYLALVCLHRADSFAEKRGLLEYNLTVFRESVAEVLKSTLKNK
jgi:hypothetical protein